MGAHHVVVAVAVLVVAVVAVVVVLLVVLRQLVECGRGVEGMAGVGAAVGLGSDEQLLARRVRRGHQLGHRWR